MTNKIKTTPRVAAAITRAINWLRANPDRHIASALAVDSYGNSVAPNDTNAQCFCFLGRVSKELNVGGYPDRDPEYRATIEAKIYSHRFTDMNDGRAEKRAVACSGRRGGNTDVLNYAASQIDLGTTPTLAERIRAFFFGK